MGGSFDPPHLCHKILALSMVTMARLEEVWIIPCGGHAFQKNLTPFFHRLHMCNLAFSGMPFVKVVAVEDTLPKPNFTVNTLKFLKARFPMIHFTLGLGSDLVGDFPKWHDSQEISNLADIAIFMRQSFALSTLPPGLKNARVYDEFLLPNINSTTLRTALSAQGATSSPAVIDEAVAQYCVRQSLY